MAARWPGALCACLLAWQAPAAEPAAAPRATLAADAFESGRYRGPVDFAAYAAPARATAPTHRFEGHLSLSGTPATRTLVADRDYLGKTGLRDARSLPGVELDFTMDGDTVLPLVRTPVDSSHLHWQWLFSPGRAWDEPGDGGLTRVAIPFALVQANANCTHNGVLMLLVGDGAPRRAAMQVGSETCQYLQLDMWGFLDAGFEAGPVEGAAAAIAAHRVETAARLPVRPIAEVAATHPGIDPSAFAVGDPAARTVHGLVVGGIHYRGDCATRHGAYPYCDALVVPSFSVAKSAVAGLALMRMERLYPGLAETPVPPWIAATGCRRDDWADVRFIDLLDMASGHYDSPRYMADEDDARVAAFFNARSHAHKLAFACEAYPRRQAPGTRWIYHTADTYLLGTALRGFLRSREPGGDVFDDIVVGDAFAPLGLSPTARYSRRTDDATAQAFFGWGLFLHPDDLVRLALFLQHGRIAGRDVLDQRLLDEAMQRVPGRRGLPVATLEDYRYQHGFWARRLPGPPGCGEETWIPFMSGFGGITVAYFGEGVAWYSIADDGELASIDFAGPAREAAKLPGACAAEATRQ